MSHSIVFEFGNKQTITLEVDGQVVNAAANLAERDFPLEQERCLLGATRADDERAGDRKRYRKWLHRLFPSSSALPSILRGYRQAVESGNGVGLGP
jgi:hypothetical protein